MLPLHVGGDLDDKHVRGVDDHLHACLNCFREFRELATMRGRLGVLADAPLPDGILDGFTEEVMARIAVGEEGPAATPPGQLAPVRRLWPRMAAAAAVLLAVALGVRFAASPATDALTPDAGHSVIDSGTTVAGTTPRIDLGVDRGTGSRAEPDSETGLMPGWPAPAATGSSFGGYQGATGLPASMGGLPPSAGTAVPDDPSAVLRQAQSSGRMFYLLPNASQHVLKLRFEVDDRRAPRPRNPGWQKVNDPR